MSAGHQAAGGGVSHSVHVPDYRSRVAGSARARHRNTRMRPPAEGPTHQPAVARVAPGRFARVGRFELARVRPGAPISHSPTARLGFWSAVLAASASLVFLVASGPVLLGAVAPP